MHCRIRLDYFVDFTLFPVRVMASSSVEDLHKVLNVSLLELLEEQNLVRLNINSNGSITSVVIRFTMQGSHDFNTPVTWRKSPSHYRRNTQRNTSYMNQ